VRMLMPLLYFCSMSIFYFISQSLSFLLLSVIGTPLRRVVEKLFVAQKVRLLLFLCVTIGFFTILTVAAYQTLYDKTLSNIPHVFIARSPKRSVPFSCAFKGVSCDACCMSCPFPPSLF